MDFNNLADMQLRDVIRKAAVYTGGAYGSSGLLNPEQSSAFMDMIQDSSEFLKKMRFERRRVKKGTISKLGVGSRLLRGFEENTVQCRYWILLNFIVMWIIL